MNEARRRQERILFWGLVALLTLLALYLVRGHYVKVYSDPVGWLLRAERMAEGQPVTSRPPVYPAFLVGALKLLGPYYVFLANLPLLILMMLLFYLMTKKTFRRREPFHGPHGSDAGLAGLAATAIIIVLNRDVFLWLLNPYREALAYTLMLSSLVLLISFLDVKRPWKVTIAGLLLGLSIGARETCVLVLPPLGMLYLYSVFTDRELPALRTAFFFGIGLLIGLLPLFYQNVLHTGHFWLPSYAASRFQPIDPAANPGDIVKPREFPVPGMGGVHFFETGRKTVEFFRVKYGWWGLSLLVVGVVQSIRRRHILFLLLLLPSGALHFLFYCFYWYIKERYLFAVDLFIVPVMGAGLAALILGGAAVLEKAWRGKGLSPVPLTVILAVIVVAASVQATVLKGSKRFQVWDVKEFRDTVMSRLETPFRVISSRKYHRQALSWLLRTPYEHKEVGIDDEELVSVGFDGAMRSAASKYLSSYRRPDTYSYSRIFLLENWFDFEEVLDFKEIASPPDLYGVDMRDKLYHVVPWSEKEILRSVEVAPGSGKHMLLADLRRLWDYQERSFCRLALGGQEVLDRVPNGLHLVEIPPGRITDGKVEVGAVSDAPLPAEVLLETRVINEPWTIPLGAGPKYWYYPYLSEDLLRNAPLKPEATVLFDRGTVTLPSFAERDREVFAVFHLEFFQETPYFQSPNRIVLQGGGEPSENVLPGRRQTGLVTVSLGRGRGGLELVPVTIETTLPSREKQERMRSSLEIRGYGYVKLFSVRLVSVPTVLKEQVAVDVGTMDDSPWLKEGFFPHEKYKGSRPVRWTSGHSRIRLPRVGEGAGVEARVVIREARPESVRDTPRFVVNGETVPPGEVTARALEDDGIEYRFHSAGGKGPAEGMGELEILAEPWVPSRVIGSRDDRELGVMLDLVEFVPVALPRGEGEKSAL
jgi:hypothetical protein